jgi:CHAT domain-containing protein/tetratricopeptide (TPR) repeat protein
LKSAKFVAFCLLVVPLTGPGSGSVWKLRALPLSGVEDKSSDLLLQAALIEGRKLYSAEKYDEAAKQFDLVSRNAAQAHDLQIAARARGNVGGAQFAMHQYRAALSSFLSARSLAESAGDASILAMLDANLASLSTEMGDYEGASHWIEGALSRMTGADLANHSAEVRIQFAIVRAHQKRMPEALTLFRQGIEAAARTGNWNLYAFGWNRLGEEYLEANEIARHSGDTEAAEKELGLAEGPLLEAYRVRKLRLLALDTSYRNLGLLRLEQGDLQGASVLLDHAIELSTQPNGPIPAWYAYLYRGRLRLAQGRLGEALADLRVAARLARAWRWSAPPDDGMRIGAEGWLDPLYSALIEAGNRLYMKNGDPALIRETFEAADENRANSLRALVERRNDAATTLPPSYWAALLCLQRAEVAALRHATPASEEGARNARAQVAQIEASSASGPPPATDDLLRRARAGLGRDSAVIAFHMGDQDSWMWAVDGDGIALYLLAPRGTLIPIIEVASRAIRDGDATSTAGATLYQALFGSLAPRFQHMSRWLLGLDGPLFDVPFAALPVPSQGPSLKAQFLVERHVVQIVPSVAYWLAPGNPPTPRSDTSLFLGVGDPIYNLADPRLSKAARTAGLRASPLDLFAALLSPLPRLVASSAELDACARGWKGNRVLLEGTDASRSAIERQIGRHPDVLHFATHFVPSDEPKPQGTIALSLTDGGVVDLLRPAEIALWHTDVQLVVLSGCYSAAGTVLPGTGLLGLNRAWLAAGANNVISSHWAVPDESGSLFAALYRSLSARGLSAAQSLRDGQLEMLRSTDWRARPQYWGAYFAMGKE